VTTYFLLVHFTDEGIRDIKDTIGRAEAFEQMAKKSGVTLRELFWSAAALTLSASSLGSVRSEILRAFSFEDMKQILGKMV
jgi:uncharacterized protein with GYD domain